MLTSQIVDVGIAQSGVEDLDVLAGYKAAGVDLFPIQMADLLRIGGLMLLAAAGSSKSSVEPEFHEAHRDRLPPLQAHGQIGRAHV